MKVNVLLVRLSSFEARDKPGRHRRNQRHLLWILEPENMRKLSDSTNFSFHCCHEATRCHAELNRTVKSWIVTAGGGRQSVVKQNTTAASKPHQLSFL